MVSSALWSSGKLYLLKYKQNSTTVKSLRWELLSREEITRILKTGPKAEAIGECSTLAFSQDFVQCALILPRTLPQEWCHPQRPGLPTSIVNKKIHHRLVHRSAWWRQSSLWGPLSWVTLVCIKLTIATQRGTPRYTLCQAPWSLPTSSSVSIYKERKIFTAEQMN